MTAVVWSPPFCAHETDLACPVCKEPGAVRVREKDKCFDGEEVEAYCCDCHATLQVYASVNIEFSDPEVDE